MHSIFIKSILPIPTVVYDSQAFNTIGKKLIIAGINAQNITTGMSQVSEIK
jgi:hypothetical protein